MRIHEVVVQPKYTSWETLKNSKLVPKIYNMYSIIQKRSNGFKIPANQIYSEWEITDLSIDFSSYKSSLLTYFSESDQVIKVINRIISYLEFNELD